jgi:hypothetical protein
MNPVGGAQKSAKSFSGEIRKSELGRFATLWQQVV